MGRSVHPPVTAVRDAVARALAEDIEPLGDVTAALLDDGCRARAAIIPRTGGVLAGRACAQATFEAVEPSVVVRWEADDGDELVAGGVIARLEGPLAGILTAERTALNFLTHLSGIATLTRQLTRAVAGTGCRVLDTRKTTPGLRALEKAAVRAGGGRNHRGNLAQAVLVKDNHLGGLSIEEAVRRARDLWPMCVVEVECDELDQVRRAVAAGADVVMLDNFDPPAVAEAVRVVAGRALVEVSGGVTLETAARFAEAGADLISVGALTHSAPAVDIGLDLLG